MCGVYRCECGVPVRDNPKQFEFLVQESPLSDAISKDLKKHCVDYQRSASASRILSFAKRTTNTHKMCYLNKSSSLISIRMAA